MYVMIDDLNISNLDDTGVTQRPATRLNKRPDEYKSDDLSSDGT